MDVRTIALILPISSFVLFLFYLLLAKGTKQANGLWTLTYSYLFGFLSSVSILLRESILGEYSYILTNGFGFLSMFLFYLGVYHYLRDEQARRRFGVPFLALVVVLITFFALVNDLYYVRVVIWSSYFFMYSLFTFYEVRRAKRADKNHYAYLPLQVVMLGFIFLNLTRIVYTIYLQEEVSLSSVEVLDAYTLGLSFVFHIVTALGFVLILNRGNVKVLEQLNLEKEKQYKEAVVISETDFLTGLANRKKLDETLLSFVKLARKSNFGFSALLIDIDDFKVINDSYGHLQGDKVLKTIANMLKRNFSEPVVYGRWGGDEFLVLLPNMRYSTVNEIRKSIISSVADYRVQGFHISLSVGITEFKKSMTEAQMFESLDKDLYENKKDS